jgi:hypothetical protein
MITILAKNKNTFKKTNIKPCCANVFLVAKDHQMAKQKMVVQLVSKK